MDGTRENDLPEKSIVQVEKGEKGFSKIKVLLDAMGGLTLSQVCSVTGLEGSTIQNWVKRGWVSHPKGKKYEERHIARILIINALKECVKLEHIALMMNYVNNCSDGRGETNIKESELYNYLCRSLQMLGQVDDFSRGGVESIVDKAMKEYDAPTIDARMRIRKALTVMIYACVCTDVKRGTEAMIRQILDELENPVTAEASSPEESESVPGEKDQQPVPESGPVAEVRKTISQTIREWEEIGNTEKQTTDININGSEEAAAAGSTEKPSGKSLLERLGIKSS